MAKLIVQPRAEADIEEALAWYHQRDPAVGERFLLELDVIFGRLSDNPLQFPIVQDPVRRALVHKFPYSVYFVLAGDLAGVVAVLHQRRRPIDWKHRSGGAR